MDVIRIGSRRSRLAVAQARLVADAITATPGGDVQVELVGISTEGDSLKGSLVDVGGRGLFTAELEKALRDGRVDLAVHSAKDMPAEMPDDLTIAAVPPRADPRDALVSHCGGGIQSLKGGAVVGTGSLRRAAQLRALRDDLEIVDLRGNVETRLGKVLGDGAGLDAAVLAMAGLKRSGLLEAHARHIHALEADAFVPAAGQGALAIQTRASNGDLGPLLEAIDHGPSHQALTAERMVLAELGVGCRSCFGIYIAPAGERWRALAMAARRDGSDMCRESADADTCDGAAKAILDKLRKSGAAGLLER